LQEKASVPVLPVLFKHMALAVFESGRGNRPKGPSSRNRLPVRSTPRPPGVDPGKLQAALDITLAQLKKYQLVTESSTFEAVTLTPRGSQLNASHIREPGSRAKTSRFDLLFNQLLVEGRNRVKREL